MSDLVNVAPFNHVSGRLTANANFAFRQNWPLAGSSTGLYTESDKERPCMRSVFPHLLQKTATKCNLFCLMKPVRGNRIDKHITIADTTIETIKNFADLHGVNFSQAIEMLALNGLQDTKTIALATLISTVVKREAAAHYNRFAKLIVHAGLEAGAAKEAAQQLYFLELQKRSEAEDLESAIGVDPDSPEGKKVIALHNKHKGRFRWRAVQALKKPLAELAEILAEIAA